MASGEKIEENKIELLQSAVIQLTGALVAVRTAVNIIAIQPNLLLSPDDREKIQEELGESVSRVDKILKLLDKLVALDAVNG